MEMMNIYVEKTGVSKKLFLFILVCQKIFNNNNNNINSPNEAIMEKSVLSDFEMIPINSNNNNTISKKNIIIEENLSMSFENQE